MKNILKSLYNFTFDNGWRIYITYYSLTVIASIYFPNSWFTQMLIYGSVILMLILALRFIIPRYIKKPMKIGDPEADKFMSPEEEEKVLAKPIPQKFIDLFK